MNTVANCPDASACPGVAHEWTPEPSVIHNPRLCLREPRRDAASPRELLRDFGGWLGRYEPTDEDIDRYLDELARPAVAITRRWYREANGATQYAHTPEVRPGVHLVEAELLHALLKEAGWRLEGTWEPGRGKWNPVTTTSGCDWCGECEWCQRAPCTCGHYHDPDSACVPECGCRP